MFDLMRFPNTSLIQFQKSKHLFAIKYFYVFMSYDIRQVDRQADAILMLTGMVCKWSV